MNRKPYIIPSKTNNKNMERYLQKKLSKAGEGGDGGESIKYTEQEERKRVKLEKKLASRV